MTRRDKHQPSTDLGDTIQVDSSIAVVGQKNDGDNRLDEGMIADYRASLQDIARSLRSELEYLEDTESRGNDSNEDVDRRLESINALLELAQREFRTVAEARRRCRAPRAVKQNLNGFLTALHKAISSTSKNGTAHAALFDHLYTQLARYREDRDSLFGELQTLQDRLEKAYAERSRLHGELRSVEARLKDKKNRAQEAEYEYRVLANNYNRLLDEFLSLNDQVESELVTYRAKLVREARKRAKAEYELRILKRLGNRAPIKSSTGRLRKLLGLGKKRNGSRYLYEDGLLLMESGYFDEDWYLQTYPDVAASNFEPVEHYLKFGGVEMRWPGPDFNPEQYLDRNPHLRESGINPLKHYLMYGECEGL